MYWLSIYLKCRFIITVARYRFSCAAADKISTDLIGGAIADTLDVNELVDACKL